MAIPPGVTTLDYFSLDGGYENMPMTTLQIPSSLKNFDACVYKCKNLSDIYCYAVDPPIIKYPDYFISQTNISKGTLYVPKGSAQAYWRAEGWKAFKNIKETLDKHKTLYIQVNENGTIEYNGLILRKTNPAYYSGQRAFETPSEESICIKIIPDEGYIVSRRLYNELYG